MSRARDLSRLSNPTNFTADGTTGRVGLGSENPTAKLNVAGIVSATAFYGDGSNLEGVASAGLGTALSDSGPGSVIYYTDKILGIAGNITVDVPDASNSNVAYTQYEEISVESGIDFIVADGDDFVPDILGLSTAGTTPLSGAGGRVRADNFTNKAGTGAPTFSSGVNVTGVATATSFSGALTGNVTGNASGTAGGLTGTPDIVVRNIIGVGATLSGVLTYEDVTNIDSVGIVTARTGIKVLAGGANIVGVTTASLGLVVSSGGINIVGGGVTVAGIATFHDGADIEGFKIEDGQTAATPNGEFNFYLASGHFFRYTGTPGADYFPNFKHSASINLNDRMDVNDVVTATLAVNSPAVTYHIANTIHIDGNATGENSYTIDTDWVGGAAPDAGNGSGYDIYSFTIIKTADKNFTILANALGAA